MTKPHGNTTSLKDNQNAVKGDVPASTRYELRLEPDVKELLYRLAEQAGMSAARLISRLIRDKQYDRRQIIEHINHPDRRRS